MVPRNLIHITDLDCMKDEYTFIERDYIKLLNYLKDYHKDITNKIVVCPICHDYMTRGCACKHCGHMYNSMLPYSTFEDGIIKHNNVTLCDVNVHDFNEALNKIQWDYIADIFKSTRYTYTNKFDGSGAIPNVTELQNTVQYCIQSLEENPQNIRLTTGGWVITRLSNNTYHIMCTLNSQTVSYYLTN